MFAFHKEALFIGFPICAFFKAGLKRPRSIKIERGSLRWAPRAGGKREGRSRPTGARVANASIEQRTRWPVTRERGVRAHVHHLVQRAIARRPEPRSPRRRRAFCNNQHTERCPIAWDNGLVRQAEVMSSAFSLKPNAILMIGTSDTADFRRLLGCRGSGSAIGRLSAWIYCRRSYCRSSEQPIFRYVIASQPLKNRSSRYEIARKWSDLIWRCAW